MSTITLHCLAPSLVHTLIQIARDPINSYAVSATFLKCAARHIPHIRHIPFEDVAIGLLAERCSVSPRNAENEKLISNFRTPFDEEKHSVEEGNPLSIETLTSPDMNGKICQVSASQHRFE